MTPNARLTTISTAAWQVKRPRLAFQILSVMRLVIEEVPTTPTTRGNRASFAVLCAAGRKGRQGAQGNARSAAGADQQRCLPAQGKLPFKHAASAGRGTRQAQRAKCQIVRECTPKLPTQRGTEWCCAGEGSGRLSRSVGQPSSRASGSGRRR
jgi:hypothetical protein